MKTASLKTLAGAAGHLERRANTAECRAEQLRSKLAVEVASGKSRKKMLEEATSAAAATEAHLKSLYACEHDLGAELKRLQALLEANRISAASMALSSRNLHASSKDYFRLLRVNLEEDLAASRKLVSKLRGELYSAKRKRARPEEEFARRSVARLPGGIRERILAAEEDAATSHALAFKLAQKHKQRLASTFALNRVLNECCVIALAVQFGSINSLIRYTWNVPGLCDIHQRDQTIDLYHECVLSLPDMTETSYNKCFNGLVAMFTAEKAAQITAFWNLGAAARKIVWSRATSPGTLYYVREYLLAAAAPTACDINKRRQGPTGGKNVWTMPPSTMTTRKECLHTNLKRYRTEKEARNGREEWH